MSGSPCACTAGLIPDPGGYGCIIESYKIDPASLPEQLADVEPGSSSTATVRVISVQTGLPRQGATVKIHLDVDSTSGGHDHGEGGKRRNRGQISSGSCDIEPGGWNATPDSYRCTTGPDGYASFTFIAPDASGKHTITATCISGYCGGQEAGWINVKVPSLWPIPAYSQWYALQDSAGKVIGAVPGKHSDNHFLTSAAIKKLKTLANVYAQISNGFPLYLNDASLIWGGLFDIGFNWATPHAGHRRGTGLDIRAANSGPNNEGAVPTTLFDELAKGATDNKIKAKLHCTQNGVLKIGTICSGIPNNRHFHVDF